MLKEHKVGNEEFELSNFNTNERIDLLEKFKNNAPTDVASTAAFNHSNNGDNDKAVNDLANKLAALQKQLDNMGKTCEGIAVNKFAIQELQKKTKDIIGKEEIEKTSA